MLLLWSFCVHLVGADVICWRESKVSTLEQFVSKHLNKVVKLSYNLPEIR